MSAKIRIKCPNCGEAKNVFSVNDACPECKKPLGLTEEGEAFPDCDVSEIKAARAAGITNGDTDGNFRPYDTI